MPTIIKAADRNQAIQPVAFQFDDIAARASRYLETARAEAAKILAEARKEADRLRQKAEADGRRQGLAAVEQMIQQQVAQQLSTLKPAMEQAVDEIRHAKHAWLRHWEKSVVHLAAAIASKLIRREIAQTPEITLTLLREALELAAGQAHLQIRLNPTDHAHLASQAQTIAQALAPLAEIEWIADPQITLGGCRVETRFGVIDQQFEAQLARIEEELV